IPGWPALWWKSNNPFRNADESPPRRGVRRVLPAQPASPLISALSARSAVKIITASARAGRYASFPRPELVHSAESAARDVKTQPSAGSLSPPGEPLESRDVGARDKQYKLRNSEGTIRYPARDG